MGRVLPRLTTRTGVTSVADALGTTKDQDLQNALRRAAFQKSEVRKTPEGMLDFVGKAASTVGKVAGAAQGVSGAIESIGSAIGKIPVSDAVRKAATAKATKQLGTLAKARSLSEQAAQATGLGQGAPVTQDIVDQITQLGQQGPAGRAAAQGLRRKALADIEMREERGRSAAAESEVGELVQEATLRGPVDMPIEQRVQERDRLQALKSSEWFGSLTDEEQATINQELASVQQSLQQPQPEPEVTDYEAEFERVVDQPEMVKDASGAMVRAYPSDEDLTESLEEVKVTTADDVRRVQVEQFVEQLGDTPAAKQANLLAFAQRAITPEQQQVVMDSVEFMDIIPGGRYRDVWGFGPGPKEVYRNKLRAAMPKGAAVGTAMHRASQRAETTRANQQREADRAAKEARQEREGREERKFKQYKETQRQFEKKRDYQLDEYKALGVEDHRLRQWRLAVKQYERQVTADRMRARDNRLRRSLQRDAINAANDRANKRRRSDARRYFSDTNKINMDVLSSKERVERQSLKVADNALQRARKARDEWVRDDSYEAQLERRKWRQDNPKVPFPEPERDQLDKDILKAEGLAEEAKKAVERVVKDRQRLANAHNDVMKQGGYNEANLADYAQIVSEVHDDDD